MSRGVDPPIDGVTEEIVYETIPLPPPRRLSRMRGRKRWLFVELKRFASNRPRLPRWTWNETRRDLGRSVCVAAACTVILVLLFFCIAWEVGGRTETPMIVDLVREVPKEEKPARSSGSPASNAADSATSPDQAPSGSPALTASATSMLSLPESTVPPLDPLLVAPPPAVSPVMSVNLAGIRKDDSAFFKGQGKDPFATGEGRSWTGNPADLFSARDLGNGSGVHVYLDQSGSMQMISEKVDAYLREHFPRSECIDIIGCSLHQNAAFPEALERYVTRDIHTVYFICDLQDQEDDAGLTQIRRVLLRRWGEPVRFMIVSFDRPASDTLFQLVTETGGIVRRE